MNHVRPSIRVSCFLLFALYLSTSLFALNNDSAITGTVVDSTGAVVRGATVDVIAHHERLSTLSTDRRGHYSVSVPAAGSYEIRVSAPGFKTAVADNLAVRNSEESIRDFTLRLDTLSEEVTVTATATPTLESHLGAAVSVLGSNQLAGTDEVQESLRWIPGVQMTQTGQVGGTTALYIRGGNSDANKVLMDGIPMNDLGGAVEFADISSSALARAEVLRGPNSSVYGADAMAGVVSLTTRSGSTPLPEVTYVGDGGNFSTFHNEANVGGKWKAADYFADFSRLDTSNSIPNNRFHIGTASGNFGWSLAPNASLRATVRHDQLAGGQPNAILLYGIPDDTRQANEDSYFGATFETQTTAAWHNLVRYGGLRLRSEYTDFAPTGIPFYTEEMLQGYLGAPVTVHGANGYTVSGQAIFQYPEQYPNTYATSTDRDSVYAQSDYLVRRHLLVLGGMRTKEAIPEAWRIRSSGGIRATHFSFRAISKAGSFTRSGQEWRTTTYSAWCQRPAPRSRTC